MWKIWIALGLFLSILELLLVPAQFLLVALGVCALLVGVLAWTLDLGLQAQLFWFAGLSVILVPVFVFAWRRSMPARYRGTAAETSATPQIGQVVSTDPLKVKLFGDTYPAESIDGTSFEPGDPVSIEGFSGITARIRGMGSTD